MRFVYDDRRYSVLLLFPIFFRATCKCLSASADVLSFALSDHRKDPVNFASFVSDIYCRADLFCCLSNRFAKERYHFTINDLVEAELTNAFAEAVGGESIHPSIEGSGNQVVIDFLVSVIRVRTILQPIDRVGELSELGVCDCQFDFFQ